MNHEYLEISQINNYIKNLIDKDYFLNKVYIKGEISNFKRHSRGHLYFTLKDDNSRINAVMFYSNATSLNFDPVDGNQVLVEGRISAYPSSGSYQVYVDKMELDGIGRLFIEYEKLKKRLAAEGLFNKEHKVKIPRYPQKIGVITADTGAAVKDIVSTIKRRFPICQVILFPTLVQGADAKDNIAMQIKRADEFGLDTIIVGRGGGSIEDLWAFNEEIVARAIYNSRIPIISGVGHEIDFTISDFVADKRAPTPTGAAIMAVPDIVEVKRYFINAKDRINSSISNKLDSYSELLKKYKSNYIINNPIRLYEMKEQKLDILYEKLNTNIMIKLDNNKHRLEKIKSNYIINNPKVLYEKNKDKLSNLYTTLNKEIMNILNNNKNRVDTIKVKLDLLNPDNVLDKGYSIIYKDNKIVKDINSINTNDSINIMVKNGNIDAIVKGVKNGKERK